MEIKRCKNIPLSEINPDDVDKLSDIKIDKRKSSNEGILDFISKVKNPYVFKVNGKLIKINFSDNGITADEALTNALKNLYR